MKSISQIESIGGIDADNDDLLINCFQNHGAYKDVIDFKKCIVIGRKGTGKTAIFKNILIEKNFDTFSFGHTFSDYPWHYHDVQVKLGVPDFERYVHSWKYLILITISKILLNEDQSIPHDERSLDYLAHIEKFIIDSYGSRNPDITQIFTPSKRLKIRPSLNVAGELLSAGVSLEQLPINDLPKVIQEVNANLSEYVLYSLNPEHKYYILFDQLDLGFDPGSPNYNDRLIGLLLAARDINNLAKQYNRKLGIVIFLRDDIYNNLKFEDKNKLTVGYSTHIEWDIKGNHTLKELVELRFTELLSENKDEKISWEDVFDETQQMTGKQEKYNYISDRTFLRPRDIIQFCNEALKAHKINSSYEDKINNDDIYKAKDEYGNYLLNELDDEIHKHIENYELLLEILKSIGYYQFDLQDYKFASSNKNYSALTEISEVDSLKDLFEFSIIGYYRAGGSGFGGSEYVFKYKDLNARFDENAKTFRVHPGLIEILRLKRTTKPKA